MNFKLINSIVISESCFKICLLGNYIYNYALILKSKKLWANTHGLAETGYAARPRAAPKVKATTKAFWLITINALRIPLQHPITEHRGNKIQPFNPKTWSLVLCIS